MEAQFAADGGYAEAVAVAADAGDDAVDQRASLRVRGRLMSSTRSLILS
jgi:hypothetical protein